MPHGQAVEGLLAGLPLGHELVHQGNERALWIGSVSRLQVCQWCSLLWLGSWTVTLFDWSKGNQPAWSSVCPFVFCKRLDSTRGKHPRAPPYQNPHSDAFVNAGYQPQGAVGATPAAWAHELPDVPDSVVLPNAPINRHDVQTFCRNADTNVLYAYVCAMAWGGQNDRFARAGQPGHKTIAWNNRQLIVPKLQALRAGGLNHCQAYALFSGANSVPCLGPAFFTKLIYFFSPPPPNGNTGFYIMDQWTAKSVNLLTQQ